MIVHIMALLGLFTAATALAITSFMLPPDEAVIVTNPSGSPDPVHSNETGSPDPIHTHDPNSSSPLPSSLNPSSKPGTDPITTATPTPSPSPSPTASALPSFGIAATSPESVLREAQVHAGRLDPFKSVYPPNLPAFDPAINPEALVLPPLPQLPQLPQLPDPPSATPEPGNPIIQETPRPPDPLEKGLVLKGIMDGGIDPIAIIEVNGATQLVRVGERLPGGILVTAIHYEDRRVNLSRGQEKGRLQMPKPTAPLY